MATWSPGEASRGSGPAWMLHLLPLPSLLQKFPFVTVLPPPVPGRRGAYGRSGRHPCKPHKPVSAAPLLSRVCQLPQQLLQLLILSPIFLAPMIAMHLPPRLLYPLTTPGAYSVPHFGVAGADVIPIFR